MNMSKIKEVLSKSEHFALVESNVYDIPVRLRAIDPSYFVIWNNIDKCFEVHSTENIGDTFCLKIPYPELDYRTLEYCRITNVGYHGENVLKLINEYNKELEERQKKDTRNRIEDAARESIWGFKRASNRKDVSDTYKNNVFIENNPLRGD